VREAVDHDVVAHGLAQVERLDRHAAHFEPHRVALVRDRELQPPRDLFEADRPADVGAERKPDLTGDVGHRERPLTRFYGV
jgi:hypothetical protein